MRFLSQDTILSKKPKMTCRVKRVCSEFESNLCNMIPRQQKFRAMNGAHLASPIRGELGYAHWPQLGSQIHCSIGNQIWGPLGKQDVCPNFALTVGKFMFSN